MWQANFEKTRMREALEWIKGDILSYRAAVKIHEFLRVFQFHILQAFWKVPQIALAGVCVRICILPNVYKFCLQYVSGSQKQNIVVLPSHLNSREQSFIYLFIYTIFFYCVCMQTSMSLQTLEGR